LPISYFFFSFFFQAEDGIRDGHVTGVQTCALPIYSHPMDRCRKQTQVPWRRRRRELHREARQAQREELPVPAGAGALELAAPVRSEERRVGKGGRGGWGGGARKRKGRREVMWRGVR